MYAFLFIVCALPTFAQKQGPSPHLEQPDPVFTCGKRNAARSCDALFAALETSVPVAGGRSVCWGGCCASWSRDCPGTSTDVLKRACD
jgi:hypothetical protein